MIRKILMLLGVMCVPIALALASQSLAATAEPPRLPQETVTVPLGGSGEPSEPAASASPDVSVPHVGEIPQQVQQNPHPVPVPGDEDLDDGWDGDVDD
ncbi:hypothetical protein [Kocuria sp.]|uniref:hypothetical protein n=1 Tax=Kocuria sp. TaxID=1871328 RepID=UPI0026DF57B8|nr:hypothetical protein [Kocuria sp.]MDO5368127.1 hypothetical protein [Kocuria sp.]